MENTYHDSTVYAIRAVGVLPARRAFMFRPTTKKAAARADLGAMAEPVLQSTLPARWDVSKSMVSQWLAEWENEGMVQRQRSGRNVIVQAVNDRQSSPDA